MKKTINTSKVERKFSIMLNTEDKAQLAATVIMTDTALADCDRGDLYPLIVASVMEDVAVGDYVLDMQAGQRFTIAVKLLHMVVTGIVVPNEDLIELVVTNVHTQALFIEGDGILVE